MHLAWHNGLTDPKCHACAVQSLAQILGVVVSGYSVFAMEASYGEIKFREVYEPAKWMSFTPAASARRLVKMMDYYWELPKPEGPLHHRSAHAHTCPYVARRSSTPALLPQPWRRADHVRIPRLSLQCCASRAPAR